MYSILLLIIYFYNSYSFQIYYVKYSLSNKISKNKLFCNPTLPSENQNKGLNITALREYIKSKMNNNSTTKIR